MKCKGEVWFLVFNNDFSVCVCVCVCDDPKVVHRLSEILVIKLVQQDEEIMNTDLDCSQVLTDDTFWSVNCFIVFVCYSAWDYIDGKIKIKWAWKHHSPPLIIRGEGGWPLIANAVHWISFSEWSACRQILMLLWTCIPTTWPSRLKPDVAAYLYDNYPCVCRLPSVMSPWV